jgi:hypothetical protein
MSFSFGIECSSRRRDEPSHAVGEYQTNANSGGERRKEHQEAGYKTRKANAFLPEIPKGMLRIKCLVKGPDNAEKPVPTAKPAE